MSRRSRVVAGLLSLGLLIPSPGPVWAVATPTTVTLTAESPVAPGEMATYAATVLPAGDVGSVGIQSSVDAGATWEWMFPLVRQADGSWLGDWDVPTESQTRLVRAVLFTSGVDYAGSTSNEVTQVIARQPSTITKVRASADQAFGYLVPGLAPVTLSADIEGANAWVPGQVTFEEFVGDAWVALGQTTPQRTFGITSQAWISTGAWSEGTHTVRVTYAGDTQYLTSTATKELAVARFQTALNAYTDVPPQANHPIPVIVEIQSFGSVERTGTLTLSEGGIDILSVGGDWTLAVTLPARPAGEYALQARYTGDATFAPSTLDFTLSVAPDSVDAVVAAPSYPTFYPYRDGYRDSTTVRGTRNEPTSVAFTVKNSVGRVIQTGSVAAGTGSYAWSWNGRTKAGTQVPAGAYTIKTDLFDGHVHKVVSQRVTVSVKRLYWYSVDLYKTGAQTQQKGTGWVAWQFTMPAGVAYKSMRLYLYAAESPSFGPGGFGAHDTSLCPFTTVYPGCVQTGFSVSKINPRWTSGALSASTNRSGRYVRAYAWAGPGARSTFYRIRLHAAYGLLR